MPRNTYQFNFYKLDFDQFALINGKIQQEQENKIALIHNSRCNEWLNNQITKLITTSGQKQILICFIGAPNK